MFLNRHNIIAWILLLAAAVCWSFGWQVLHNISQENDSKTEETSSVYVDTDMEELPEKSTDFYTWGDNPELIFPDNLSEANPASGIRIRQILGVILCFAAIFFAGIGIWGFHQTTPLFGPDGICAFLAGYSWIYCANIETAKTASIPFLTICLIFFLLLSAREIWYWMRSGCSRWWYMLYRLAAGKWEPWLPLLLFAFWITAAVSGIWFMLFCHVIYPMPLICLIAANIFGIICLSLYAIDLGHMKQQLNQYRKGQPIAVRNGIFAEAESQLLKIQAQHEEAVRTAVTSERFKVELISNVSHDLRTPLTAILGYSELLQKEALSPKGQKQLFFLYQKAGYMNDLVESLFELTKVSSGVMESKKEQIDLIRLLEQTIGLFDDQLTNMGLTVRRSYPLESILLITDGSRMHQVFANLLGNAMKYALAGTRIYLEVKETPNSWLVRMTNTASYEMDFKPEEIMQRFARGDKARSTMGSGLGLAIAQTYTESVGGSFKIAIDGDQFRAIVELPKTERNS